MPRKYENAPVLEAVCEFRFKEAEAWDWTIPGLIYERVKESFPIKRQENVLEVAVGPGQPAEAVRSGAVTKMQFVRQDGTALVQIHPNVLAVNQLRPYPKWPAFRDLILEQLKVYTEAAKQEHLARVGLRYINRIEIPAATFALEDYFAAIPTVPLGVPQTFRSFLMQVEIPHTEGPHMNLRLVIGSLPPESPEKAAVMVDLDMMSEPDYVPDMENVPAWLDTAHDRLEAAFDKSLTEKTHHELLKEVVG